MFFSRNKSNDQSPVVSQEELISLYRRALDNGVSVEEIENKINKHLRRMMTSEVIENKDQEIKEDSIKNKLSLFIKLGSLSLPMLFLIIGFYLVGSAVVPILGYYTNNNQDTQVSNLLSPIPNSQIMDVTPLVVSGYSVAENFRPALQIIDQELDYTNLSNWFYGSMPELGGPQFSIDVEEYYIDIPKLNIQNAKVKVGGTDLNESLIAYKGTALPGHPGAPVIFGHSVLRQFYNPSEKNPRRYNSIFSTIMTLQTGDEIFVTAGGVKYTYVVTRKKEVQPEDVYILEQRYDAKILKLVTCVPEGTYLRRGVVIAQLVE
jgi:LPXTG-site transpeptidase (sortase) family protein